MTWDDLKKEAGREVSMRKRVYQRKVALGTMTHAEAHERTSNMSAIYRVLKELEVSEVNMFENPEIQNFIIKIRQENLK